MGEINAACKFSFAAGINKRGMDIASAGLRHPIYPWNPSHNKRDDMPDGLGNRTGTAWEKGNRSSDWLGFRKAHQAPIPTLWSHSKSQWTWVWGDGT